MKHLILASVSALVLMACSGGDANSTKEAASNAAETVTSMTEKAQSENAKIDAWFEKSLWKA